MSSKQTDEMFRVSIYDMISVSIRVDMTSSLVHSCSFLLILLFDLFIFRVQVFDDS